MHVLPDAQPRAQAYTIDMTIPETMNDPAVTTTIGEAFIDRLMAGDETAARALLSPEATFRAITPRKVIEVAGRDDILAAFRNWFCAGWRDGLELCDSGTVEGRNRMRYRVSWSDAYAQRFVFEQQAYYDADGSGITWLELACSGHMSIRV